MWWRPVITRHHDSGAVTAPAFEHLKVIQEYQRAEAGCYVSFQIWSNRIIIFDSSETYSNFIIYRISKKPWQAKKRVGGISILPNPPKDPPEPHLTTSKDGCYSFEALRSWSWCNLPRHYCPNSVEPQGWWRVGDARFGVSLGERCEIRCEYVKGGVKVYDLTYSTEFRCVWYICWYGSGAVLVFCSSLALLKTKGLLVWRLKEDVVLLLIIRTCVVQVWRGNFQVHKAIDEFR